MGWSPRSPPRGPRSRPRLTAQQALGVARADGAIATGEAELRGGDYFGTVLNRAARVMAAGHGGQILLADSTAGLLSGIDLLDLGPRRLRDLPSAVGVFQVRAAGLRTEFPPLRTLDATPGNLRPAATSFVGRESEVAAIRAALSAHRVVTLTGVGGVGKTRLALEVAGHLADEFPDGVWVFDLAAVADPAAVPDAVAAVLGITQQPGGSIGDSVADALEGRLRLLVFDNCEHVRDAAADLVDRFRLLVGSWRGVARHQTLRHAVAWSYDLLDEAERALIQRCSVFAGGFSLQSACAVTGFDDSDDYLVLDLLDALVRKSLLVADRSGERTRFSMLETIRQFAEEQLVASGAADDTVTPRMPATSPGTKPASWRCGTAPVSAMPTTGSPGSSPTCEPPSVGPPTTATWTWPLASPHTLRCLAFASRAMSRSPGPKS